MIEYGADYKAIVRYPNTTIGKNFKYGHWVLIRENCRIGDNVSIGSFCDIEDGVIIGNNVKIHSRCFLPRYTVIEDDVWIGPGVMFANDKYPNTGGDNREGVLVRSKATICMGAKIMAGVIIGSRALVGMGAVVIDDVMPYTTVVGNPAKVVR